MELKDYLKILQKSWLVIIITTFVFALAGYLSALKSKPTTEAIVTFQVTQKPQTTDNYNFDNFYTLNASSLVAEQISGLVTSPNTVLDVYKKAGLPPPDENFKSLTKTFKSQRPNSNSNTVFVVVADESADVANKVSDTLKAKLLSDLRGQQDKGQLSSQFNITASDTSPVTTAPNSALRAVIFGLAGFIIACTGVLARRYFA